MTLAPGLRVNDNIELVRMLGRGGMGSVWVAQHRTLGIEVAVKFIHAELANTHRDMRVRFEREASLAAKIKSPHVVQMLDHGVMPDDTPYIVMELLEGEGLDALLQRRGPLPPADASKILAQTARAVGKAHTLGIVHRDLKPENLFLVAGEGDFFVKVLDFGIAKQTGMQGLADVTSSVAVVGTPSYMSLEQLVSTKDAGPSTDLWALGVIAYEMLTGRLPFDAETLPDLTLKVLCGEFVRATERNPRLGSGFDAWFHRALQKEPSDRFPTAAVLAATFRDTADGVTPAPSTELAETVIQPPSMRDDAAALGTSSSVSASSVSASGVSASTVSAVTSSPQPKKASTVLATAGGAVAVLAAVALTLIVARRSSDTEPASATPAAPASSSVAAPLSVTPEPSAARTSTASPEASASSAVAAEASATAVPRARPPVPRAPARIEPEPKQPPPQPSAQPAPSNCAGAKAFYRNAQGRLVPRRECL